MFFVFSTVFMISIILFLKENKKLKDYYHDDIKDYAEIDLNLNDRINKLKSEKDRLEKEVNPHCHSV